MRMLEGEGFAFENYIDIFDGGPTMTARTDQVRTVRDARSATVTAIGEGGDPALLATGRLAGFRAVQGRLRIREDGVGIEPATAVALGIDVGDEVLHVAR